MENRKRVTEEDLRITEALIAESFGRLEQSAVQAPSRVLKSVEQTIREHPFQAAAAATVFGVIAYALIRLMRPRVVSDKGSEQTHTHEKKTGCPDLVRQMLSVIIPLAVPYISGYIQKYIEGIHSRERDEQ